MEGPISTHNSTESHGPQYVRVFVGRAVSPGQK